MTRNHLASMLAALALTAAASTFAATKVDDRVLSNEKDGTNWASYGRTFSENHFSPLAKINSGNVGRLGLAWYYDIPRVMSTFTAPLAVDGILYFATGYSVVHAMDATTGKLLWTYDPKAPEASGQKLRGGWGIRGIAFWGGNIYTGTHDGRLIAINAKTGKPVWTAMTVTKEDGRYITSPPWVFDGKVMIGFGGADFKPDRGYVSTYDAKTGKLLWRFFVVPGNPKDGFENDAMKMAAGTWTGDWWRFGGAGGHVWGAMAYDPKYHQVYLATGNPTPWNQNIRGGGDNLFVASIVALDADTGKYKWHYQTNPGDDWDFDACLDMELATVNLGGQSRDVLMHASKNAFFYVLDRKDGKLLSAAQYGVQNWAEKIDLATGRPVEKPGIRYSKGEPVLMTPGPLGAHNIQAMSYSPVTGLMYIPKITMYYVFQDEPGDLSKWEPHPGMGVTSGLARPSKHNFKIPPASGSLLAWDPVKEKAVWEVPYTAPIHGGVASTAGNLVFQGLVTGEFIAYAADSGQKLWSFDAQDAGIEAQPITYMAHGKQYVTVITGFRGMGSPNGAKPEWDYFLQKRRVLTFVLDGKEKLPPPGPRTRPFVDDPNFVVDADKAKIGYTVYKDHCWLCHGSQLNSGGTAPDLRKSKMSMSFKQLKDVLHDGDMVAGGMPDYPELSDDEIEGLRHYFREGARKAMAQQ